jgi:hypothetical protein
LRRLARGSWAQNFNLRKGILMPTPSLETPNPPVPEPRPPVPGPGPGPPVPPAPEPEPPHPGPSAPPSVPEMDGMDAIGCEGCGRSFRTTDGPGMLASIVGACPDCGGRFVLEEGSLSSA